MKDKGTYYQNNKGRILQQQKEYYSKNRDKIKEYEVKNTEKRKVYKKKSELKKKYKISIEGYNFINTKQSNLCAICKMVCTTGKRLAVDHCHKTGKIRGLLCTKCNIGLGYFNDDVILLKNSIRYLE